MTAVIASECIGLWRRTLLVDGDGATDTSAGVLWLQGVTGYVDSRGFAGTLAQDGNIFEWHRAVNIEPPGEFPDAGEMRWDQDILVEAGVHEPYLEHWVRDSATTMPCGSLFLVGPDDAVGLLVRVGAMFGWAAGGEVVIAPVGGPRWASFEITEDHVQDDGVRWHIEVSEGNVNS